MSNTSKENKEAKIGDIEEIDPKELFKIFAGYDSWVPSLDKETMKTFLVKVGSKKIKS